MSVNIRHIDNKKAMTILEGYLKDSNSVLDENIEDLFLDNSLSSDVDALLHDMWESDDVQNFTFSKEHNESVLNKIKQNSTTKVVPLVRKRAIIYIRAIAAVLVTGFLATTLYFAFNNETTPIESVAEVAVQAPIEPTVLPEAPIAEVAPAKPAAVPVVKQKEVVAESVEPVIEEIPAVQAPVEEYVAEAPKRKIIDVPLGETMKVQLPDGSDVTLKGGSQLSYGEFNGNSRTVNLNGDAYFSVAKNGVPFIVEGSRLNVRVTGTEFNVDNFSSNPFAIVKVAQGSVVVSTPSKVLYYLNAGSELSYNSQRAEVTVAVQVGSVKVVTPTGETYNIEPDNKMKYDTKTKDVLIEKTKSKNKKKG